MPEILLNKKSHKLFLGETKMRYYSTAKKHTDLTQTLLTICPFKVYPNERFPRSIKMLGVDTTNKEASINSAIAQANKLRRDLKNLNQFNWSHLPPNQRRRYSVCKEYLTAEEVNRRLEENPEQLDMPELSYLKDIAGWYFWIQESPAQEELLSIKYKELVLAEKQSMRLQEEIDEEKDYG